VKKTSKSRSKQGFSWFSSGSTVVVCLDVFPAKIYLPISTGTIAFNQLSFKKPWSLFPLRFLIPSSRWYERHNHFRALETTHVPRKTSNIYQLMDFKPCSYALTTPKRPRSIPLWYYLKKTTKQNPVSTYFLMPSSQWYKRLNYRVQSPGHGRRTHLLLYCMWNAEVLCGYRRLSLLN
jgi:hypothetical protein